MGYLDSDSITVDAILTKHGRKKLSDGGGLGITYFALSDDGVDYSLWNSSHPSGSDSYDDAISALPNLEAVPDDTVIMQNNLITSDRNLMFWPLIQGVDKSYIINDTSYEQTIVADTANFGQENYNWEFPNVESANMIKPSLGSGKIYGSTDMRFVPGANIPHSVAFEGYPSVAFTCATTDKPTSFYINITGQESGARFTTTIYCHENQPVIRGGGVKKT